MSSTLVSILRNVLIQERTTQRKDTFLGKWVKAIKRNKIRAGIRTNPNTQFGILFFTVLYVLSKKYYNQ